MTGRNVRFAIFALSACVLSGCGDRDRVVHAILPAARGLSEGALVRYRGIVVGSVKTVRIVDSGVRLDLGIERADAPLRTGDQVRITSVGMFGDREVDIVPGPLNTPRLATEGSLRAYPPDTLAAIREALVGAVVKNAFERLGVFDTARAPGQRTSSLQPPAARSHP